MMLGLATGVSSLGGGCGEPEATPGSPANSTAGSPTAGSPTTSGGSAQSGGPATAGVQQSGGSGGASSSVGGSSGDGGTNNSAGANAGSAGSSAGGVNQAGGSNTGTTLVPDALWACGKPDGLVDPTRGELVFKTTLNAGTVRDVGLTQYGKRRATDITGGTISGDKLDATFLPGGLDYELTLSNGVVELEQVGMLKAKDGALVYLRTCGVAPAGDALVRLVPDFEAPKNSSVAWLNTGSFVGTRRLDAAGKTIELAVYDVSKVAADAPKLQLKAPTDAPHQPWDCAKASGSKSTEVFTETVTLGGSLAVGESKRGTRNVIPITGGTISGKLTGSIVSAGADYQLVGGTTTLDARYVLSTNDGEVVVVRNCGPFGALIPQFETRAAGPYAFLNSGKFISSDPGSAAGGVKITFFELK
jgi:Protein of unknown function (DUF3237)